MTSSKPPSHRAVNEEPPPPDHDPLDDGYRTSRFNVLAVIALAIVAFVAALGITIAINAGDETRELPPGYFGDVARLSERAAEDIATLAPDPDARAACLADDTGAACDDYANAARDVARRLGPLIGDFAALRPPTIARDWHAEYRDALRDIRDAFSDQARAIVGRALDAFQAALARGDAAVASEIALTEQFNADFARQLAGS